MCKVTGLCKKTNKTVELKIKFARVKMCGTLQEGYKFLDIINRNCVKCELNKECDLFNVARNLKC